VKDSDSWETPEWLYNELCDEFGFQIDLCASETNRKCRLWSDNFLDDKIDTVLEITEVEVGFMNPPYSCPYKFVEKAMKLVRDGKLKIVVCLLKCDTSTKAWGLLWDYENHHPKTGVSVRFLSKRLKFERDGVTTESAKFANVIVILNGVR
jgi:site-specific DNA-methyltransferase (adenine-specific)